MLHIQPISQFIWLLFNYSLKPPPIRTVFRFFTVWNDVCGDSDTVFIFIAELVGFLCAHKKN